MKKLTIVPFCTSASSGVGFSAERLHELCSGETIWMDGIRFSAGTDEEAIIKWIDEMQQAMTEQ